MNGTKAAINAGYSEASAHVAASRLIRNDKVSEMVREITDKATEDAQIAVNDIVAGLKKIAQDEELKPSDRIRAYEILGKYKGMFTDRLEVTEESKPQVVLYWPDNGRDPEATALYNRDGPKQPRSYAPK